MAEPLRKVLHPEAIKKFEDYLQSLITETRFWCDFEPVSRYEEECVHFCFFPQVIMDKLENLLRPVGYLDRNDIYAICDGILDYLLWKYKVIKNKFRNTVPHPPMNDKEFRQPRIINEIAPKIGDHLDRKFQAAAKKTICKYFYSLPIDYVVLFPLPYVELPSLRPIKISHDIELLRIEKDFKNNHSPPCWSKLLRSGLLNPPKKEKRLWIIPHPYKAYVLVKVHGASIHSSINKMCEYAERQFKIMVAALYALDIVVEYNGESGEINPDSALNSGLVTPVSNVRNMFRWENESAWAKLSPVDWDFIRKLRLNDAMLEPSPFEKEAMERLKKVDSPDEELRRLERMLGPIKKVFVDNCPEEKMAEIERVKRALLWFYNGLIAKDEPFSFIFLTVAVEALLGVPKGSAAMTERIADRLTFLIADDALERKEIKINFLEAYDIRSKIVHEGKAKLDKEDKVHYTNLKLYIQKALAKEIEALPLLETIHETTSMVDPSELNLSQSLH